MEPRSPQDLKQALCELPSSIARGNGRSYGDASLNDEGVIFTRRLAHFESFDQSSGELTCEAGALLSDIIDVFLPRGWFPTVTPGTRFVTVGGMIAADVHGKNHHMDGSFCDHLRWLDLALPDGRVLRCSARQHPDLFAATCGGMGLTGVIERACFVLRRIETAYIRQRTHRAPTLAHAFELFEEARQSTYSVGWIDALAAGSKLGRSVIFTGEHALLKDLPPERKARALTSDRASPKNIPFNFPTIALSRLSVSMFNSLYYRSRKDGSSLVNIFQYFYPLDSLINWNRIYGRPGFLQYQCVLPLAESFKGMSALLTAVERAGSASFLAVLKRMGRRSFGMLSFPMEGYTLALDFPVTPQNLALLDRLDLITKDHGGHIYLAKDARTSSSLLRHSYSRLADFEALRDDYGLSGRMESALSRRLNIR